MNRIIDWFRREETRTSSMITLFVVNLFPIFGVLYWGWDVFPIMLLYWSENVIIGVFNIFRMLFAHPDESEGCMKYFLIPFFAVHYGMFTLVHGFFVVMLFGGDGGLMSKGGDPSPALMLQMILENNLVYAVIALFLSHGYSFVKNYLGHGEYRRTTLQSLMFRPYSRVVILHLTLIFGAFLIVVLKLPLAGLILFIVLKIIIDLIAHTREHRRA
ncbi:hypothetical protein JXO52_02170 [bacterium]|nr:hypothetical protein [bacterium]